MTSEWASDPHEPSNPIVMPGLVPGISLSQTRRTLGERVDGRDKLGHDVLGFPAMHTNLSIRTLAECRARLKLAAFLGALAWGRLLTGSSSDRPTF